MNLLGVYVLTQVAISLVAIGAGSFLLMGREHWALVVSRRAEGADAERTAGVFRRKFLGWGVALIIAGLLQMGFVVYVVVSR